MQRRQLVLPVLLLAAAVTLAQALVTRDGVGVFEYVVGATILALLLTTAVRLSLRAVGRI
jgi:uncharacterized membrane protein